MISIQALHTFQLPVYAAEVRELHTVSDIQKFMQNYIPGTHLLLGGGSNVVFVHDFQGIIGRICTKGIEILSENETHVEVQVQAGENWHDFVVWAVENGYGGIENLALIPGTVGAAPIQNIGAYGTEVKDTILRVEVLYAGSSEVIRIQKHECNFLYRNSIFKQTLKDSCAVISVVFQLQKSPHSIEIGYGDVKAVFERNAIPGIAGVMQAIIEIRQQKLPDPKLIGNCGSFFKNPVIASVLANSLQAVFPEMPQYQNGAEVKIPAAWLIESVGFKGFEYNGLRVHPKQALVLTNLNAKNGSVVLELVNMIQTAVWQKFQIALEPEVNIIQ